MFNTHTHTHNARARAYFIYNLLLIKIAGKPALFRDTLLMTALAILSDVSRDRSCIYINIK